MERIINNKAATGNGADAYLDTVHPHLDKKWHAHAYLPELIADDDAAEVKRILKAFLVNAALGLCIFGEYEQTCYAWCYQFAGERFLTPLVYCGKPAINRSNFVLLKVFDQNTRLVNEITEITKTKIDESSRALFDGAIDADKIASCEIIKQMICKPQKGTDNTTGVNILDYIYSIYLQSNDIERLSARFFYQPV